MFDSEHNKKTDAVELGEMGASRSVDKCVDQPSYNHNEQRWGDQRASFFDYQLTVNGADQSNCNSGDKLSLTVHAEFHEALDGLVYGLTVKTADGVAVYGTNTRIQEDVAATSQKAGDKVTLHEKDVIAIDRRYDMIHLKVMPVAGQQAFGIAEMNAQLSTK